MKKYIIMMIIAIVGALIAASQVEAKEIKKEETIRSTQKEITECTKEAILKGYGWSGAYGAGVMALGAGLGLIVAPAAAPVAVAVIGINAVIGGAIGIGSSAVTRISDETFFDQNPIVTACIKKVLK